MIEFLISCDFNKVFSRTLKFKTSCIKETLAKCSTNIAFSQCWYNIHFQIVKIVPFSLYHRRKYGSIRSVFRSHGLTSGYPR